jgi:lactose/L-arabinose transport system ATP-binding protein
LARGIAMVFESYALYPQLTLRDSLGFRLTMANISADRIGARVNGAAQILKIEHLLDRRPGQLSGR